MEPLYKIGELVVRQAPSTNYPEDNGEYLVLEVITVEDYRIMYSPTNFGKLTSNFYYKLDGLATKLKVSGMISCHSAEQFLRKKHLPSSESFDKLMSSLKQPQRV